MLKCLHCDGTLSPGKLLSQYAIQFEPNKHPLFTLTTNRVDVAALMCEGCGRIELRGDTEKLGTVLGR